MTTSNITSNHKILLCLVRVGLLINPAWKGCFLGRSTVQKKKKKKRESLEPAVDWRPAGII